MFLEKFPYRVKFYTKGEGEGKKFEFCCATVEVLHRTSKWGEVRRLAGPLRRFPFAAPPNCGRKGGTQYQRGMVETSDIRQSDFRLAVRLETYTPPMTGI